MRDNAIFKNKTIVNLAGAFGLSAGMVAPAIAAPRIPDNCELIQSGRASWYGDDDGFNHHDLTANQERFDYNAMTAAHRTLPFNTNVLVVRDDRTLEVRINDRGPYARGRIIDLTKGAATALGYKNAGTAQVSLYECS